MGFKGDFVARLRTSRQHQPTINMPKQIMEIKDFLLKARRRTPSRCRSRKTLTTPSSRCVVPGTCTPLLSPTRKRPRNRSSLCPQVSRSKNSSESVVGMLFNKQALSQKKKKKKKKKVLALIPLL